jgi:hypothetical protein
MPGALPRDGAPQGALRDPPAGQRRASGGAKPVQLGPIAFSSLAADRRRRVREPRRSPPATLIRLQQRQKHSLAMQRELKRLDQC